MAAPRFDLPTVEDETRPFWDAAAEGTLLIQRCGACDEWQYYPRPFCKRCWSEDVAWVEASGKGTVYTFSIVRRNDMPPFPDRVPYVPAIIELEEGPRMMSEVVGLEPEQVQIGQAVVVDFAAMDDELKRPVFRPA
jgi:uncharacterized OB-fold protein